MKLRDILPLHITARFVPEPEELTPELARFIRAKFWRDPMTIDARIALNALAAQVSYRNLYGVRIRGCGYFACSGCRKYFGPDEDFTSDVSRCRSCYGYEGFFECPGCGSHRESECSECNKCSECCDCTRCERCNEISDSVCGGCNCCERHCNGCRYCDACCEYSTDGNDCGDCDRCDDCCTCSSDEERDESYSPKPQTHPAAGRQKVFACNRMVGVEVEYNRSENPDPIKAWARNWGAAIHSDGSCGWEAVSSPAAGDKLVCQLNQLGVALDEANATHDSSCGIHVHVDARDLRWRDMLRLVDLYAHLEPMLYLIGGQSRTRNIYCAPVGERYREAVIDADPKSALLGAVYSGSRYVTEGGRACRRKIHPSKKEGSFGGYVTESWGRYVGLNVCPWIAGRARANKIEKDTTVEFRLHREYTRPDRLLGWAKLCARIVDYAASDADIAALRGMSAARALTVIAPDLAGWIVERLREYRRAVPRRNRLIGYQASIGYTIGRMPRVQKTRTTALAA